MTKRIFIAGAIGRRLATLLTGSLFFLALIGCESADTFRFVDGNSGKPIAGVSAVSTSYREPFEMMEVRKFGPSTADGIVKIVPTYNAFIAVDAPGYIGVDVAVYSDYIIYDRGETSAPRSQLLKPGSVLILKAEKELAHHPILADRVIIVPLAAQ